MTRMTRMVLAVLLTVLVTACAGRSTGDSPPDDDAEVFKIKMDAFVLDTLPKLQASIGGEWGGFTGQFFQKGGSMGLWDYTAAGWTNSPPGTSEEVLDKVEAVLREQGMDITRPGYGTDITARKDGILVVVFRSPESDIESVSTLRMEFISDNQLSSKDDFAENAGYTDLLK